MSLTLKKLGLLDSCPDCPSKIVVFEVDVASIVSKPLAFNVRCTYRQTHTSEKAIIFVRLRELGGDKNNYLSTAGYNVLRTVAC